MLQEYHPEVAVEERSEQEQYVRVKETTEKNPIYDVNKEGGDEGRYHETEEEESVLGRHDS